MTNNNNQPNTVDRNVAGTRPLVAVLAALVVLSDLLQIKSMIQYFKQADYFDGKYKTFMIVLGLIGLLSIVMWLVLTIAIAVGSDNKSIGGLLYIFACASGISFFLNLDMNDWHMSFDFFCVYGMIVAFYLSMAILLTANPAALRAAWFIPGIIYCIYLFVPILDYIGEYFRVAFTSFQGFLSMIASPLVLLLFAFIFMGWAAERVRPMHAGVGQQAYNNGYYPGPVQGGYYPQNNLPYPPQNYPNYGQPGYPQNNNQYGQPQYGQPPYGQPQYPVNGQQYTGPVYPVPQMQYQPQPQPQPNMPQQNDIQQHSPMPEENPAVVPSEPENSGNSEDPDDLYVCHVCGNVFSSGNSFCSQCGTPVNK